ncbi:MAG TPA: FAD-dependent oxidoreductase, partial [Bacillota bacterium]
MNIGQERQMQLTDKKSGELFENKNTPIIDKVDVVVAGGGVAGFTAAIAASRNGAKVILVEQAGYLGGYITGGLVNYMTPYKDWYEQIVGGLAEEIVEKMRQI